MKIDIVDGFKMLSDITRKPTLVIESERLVDCMHYAQEKKITRIYLQKNFGFNLSDVDFFKKYDFFTEVSVIKDLNDIDVSGIQFLKQLVRVTLSNENQGLDFSNFPQLEEASIDWNSKVINLSQCKKLNSLVLWKFKPKSGSFKELKGLGNLTSLKITQSDIKSLSCLEELPHLENFEAYYLSKLEDLSAIDVVRHSLKSLILEKCKKLHDYEDALGSLTVLRKLILSDCGTLKNLKFVHKLKELVFFSFVGTNVEDGDLSLLLKRKFEWVGFDDKRHYSHKMKELNPS
jgi:protein phosphatase 1 regulatory subunit 7